MHFADNLYLFLYINDHDMNEMRVTRVTAIMNFIKMRLKLMPGPVYNFIVINFNSYLTMISSIYIPQLHYIY